MKSILYRVALLTAPMVFLTIPGTVGGILTIVIYWFILMTLGRAGALNTSLEEALARTKNSIMKDALFTTIGGSLSFTVIYTLALTTITSYSEYLQSGNLASAGSVIATTLALLVLLAGFPIISAGILYEYFKRSNLSAVITSYYHGLKTAALWSAIHKKEALALSLAGILTGWITVNVIPRALPPIASGIFLLVSAGLIITEGVSRMRRT